jgi:PAS domain S-box-containing protein
MTDKSGEEAVEDESFRERFGQLLDTSGQMFWELDRQFRVTFANDLLKRTFGDPVGKFCHEFMAGTNQICPDCAVQKIYDGADRAVAERVRFGQAGEAIWLEHTATPIKNEAGEVIGASELTVDTTKRRQAEDWLKDSERRYRNLVEQVPDVIFSLDEAGRFTFINTQAEKLFGYPIQKILETSLSDHVAAEDTHRVQEILDLQPDIIWDDDIAVIDSEGSKKIIRIRCKASFEETSRSITIDGVMRDRTLRRRLEEELKASKQAVLEKIRIIDELYEHIVQSGKCKAIEEHTAEVAHELRQPLAIVGGFARRLARQLEGADQIDVQKQKQYATIIISEICRLERILDRLIDFTSHEKLRLQHINPNELIEYIVSITATHIKDKQIRLELNLGPEITDVPLDPGRFQQLVLNLVTNAVEASPVGGAVEIESGVSLPSEKAIRVGELGSERFFEMKIRNTGPVIPKEALQNIFNPFFTTKKRGTGLGLAVSKKIVEDHDGSISVKSDADGTVFTVWLPLAELARKAASGCELEPPCQWQV